MRGIFNDLLVVLGLAGLGYGLWLRMPWLAFVVVGAIVFLLGVIMHMRSGRNAV